MFLLVSTKEAPLNLTFSPVTAVSMAGSYLKVVERKSKQTDSGAELKLQAWEQERILGKFPILQVLDRRRADVRMTWGG